MFSDAAPVLEGACYEDADLIITDMDMPTSGVELIRQVREQGCEVPIVVVSGRSYVEVMALLDGLKVEAVLDKPFQRAELLSHLEQQLKSTSTAMSVSSV